MYALLISTDEVINMWQENRLVFCLPGVRKFFWEEGLLQPFSGTRSKDILPVQVKLTGLLSY